MKTLFLFLSLFCANVIAQEGNVPLEAKNEILRRGNHVEIVDGIQGDDTVGQIASTPEDDSYKWYISVITKSGCSACERLKYDFANAKELQAWVNTADYTKSFTHYNVWRAEDRLQQHRWKDVQIKAYPTLIIQPPRNGAYGPNSTVVAQLTGYDGNTKKLSQYIRDRISIYVAKYKEQRSQATVAVDGGFKQTDGKVGQRRPSPEFLPPDTTPSVTPFLPPELDNPNPSILPENSVGVVGGVKQIASGFINVVTELWKGLHTVLLIVLVGLVAYMLYKNRTPTPKAPSVTV